MCSTTPMIRKPRLRRSLVLSLAFAGLMLSNLAPQAFAQTSTSSGSPGQAQFNPTVQGSHTLLSSGATAPYLAHAVTAICRSSRTSGNQTFAATYYVYKWTGSSWASIPSAAPLSVRIPAGYACVSLTSFRWSQAFTSGGYFYVAVVLTWSDAYGSWLGSKTWRFDAQGDYSCATLYPCQSGPGWIYLQ